MHRYIVNLDGVAVLGINDEAIIPEILIELEHQIVGFPTCRLRTPSAGQDGASPEFGTLRANVNAIMRSAATMMIMLSETNLRDRLY